MQETFNLDLIYPVGSLIVLPDDKKPSDVFLGEWSQVQRVQVPAPKDREKIPGYFEKFSEDETEIVQAAIWTRTA